MMERLQSYERQALEAEKELSEQSEIPQASMFSYKAALETAQGIVERQKKSLATKGIIAAQNEKQQAEIKNLHETVSALHQKMSQLELGKAEEQKQSRAEVRRLNDTNRNLLARLEETERFFRWNTTAAMMRDDYEREQREEARRKAEERKRLVQEIEQKAQQEREEQQRREAEQERQREVQQQEKERECERQRAQSLERRPRGMGMGR
jgi:hypothetical protein